jgi:hypothetical protein
LYIFHWTEFRWCWPLFSFFGVWKLIWVQAKDGGAGWLAPLNIQATLVVAWIFLNKPINFLAHSPLEESYCVHFVCLSIAALERKIWNYEKIGFEPEHALGVWRVTSIYFCEIIYVSRSNYNHSKQLPWVSNWILYLKSLQIWQILSKSWNSSLYSSPLENALEFLTAYYIFIWFNIKRWWSPIEKIRYNLYGYLRHTGSENTKNSRQIVHNYTPIFHLEKFEKSTDK